MTQLNVLLSEEKNKVTDLERMYQEAQQIMTESQEQIRSRDAEIVAFKRQLQSMVAEQVGAKIGMSDETARQSENMNERMKI